ncbi:MAG: sensor histidine kinase, partial [Aggregatilineales bacterium]
IGYGEDDRPAGAEGWVWPLTGAFARVLRQRRGDMVSRGAFDFVPCLRGSTSQIILPMVAGGDVNGMLIVETNRDPQLTLVHLAQLYRLSDHAGIALANAQLYAELTRANDSKSEFVSFVAHELKTPMTSIKGYTDLLLMGYNAGKLDSQQEAFLRTIRANIERMDTLVSDLNDVTKMETNNLHMQFGPVNFSSVITETLRPLQRPIEDRQQTLEINVPPDLPPLYGDQNRLIQVLTNLLSNAHKYTPAGGRITITAEIVPNRWNAQSKPAEPVCHVMVRDTGIGISPEDVSRLFTPYFRSENPLAREQPGTGLGLTIVRGIVERHNGRIWVESELGQGTVFHFTVPLAAAIEAAPVGN